MPDRYLRAAILLSKAVNSLTQGAELFYRRLMSVVDDFGRFEADPDVLLPECYPRQLTTRKTDISRWLTECDSAGVVLLYEVDGKSYLWLLKTDPPRAKSSKYPPHPKDHRPCIVKRAHADMCVQAQTNVPYSLSGSSSIPSPPSGGVGGGRGVNGRKKNAAAERLDEWAGDQK